MSTITTTVSNFSNPTDRANQTAAEFSTAADDTIADLEDNIIPEINDVADEMNTVAGEVNTNATNALASKNSAADSEAVALAAANFEGEWDDLTGALSVPASVYHDSAYWMLLSDLADVTAKEPGVDSEWSAIYPSPFTVVPQTGGGTLTAGRTNELRDGNTGYLIPLAASVPTNTTIEISQPDRYVANEPVATRSGSDTITDKDGTDTSITFSNTSSIKISLTSDGVSDWSM
jgi:hypothetical protein